MKPSLLQTHYLDERPKDSRSRILEIVINDLWRQHPVWPTTVSGCAGDGCDEAARGGHLCRRCLRECLAELAGPELADQYCGAVLTCQRVRFQMMDRVEGKEETAVDAVAPSDSDMVDYLASLWGSRQDGHHLMGRWFPNPTGSFRDAVRARMSQPHARP